MNIDYNEDIRKDFDSSDASSTNNFVIDFSGSIMNEEDVSRRSQEVYTKNNAEYSNAISPLTFLPSSFDHSLSLKQHNIPYLVASNVSHGITRHFRNGNIVETFPYVQNVPIYSCFQSNYVSSGARTTLPHPSALKNHLGILEKPAQANRRANENKGVKRLRLTSQQYCHLEIYFNGNQYPSKEEKLRLSYLLKLPVKKITVWFSNRRSKMKKEKEKEIELFQQMAYDNNEFENDSV